MTDHPEGPTGVWVEYADGTRYTDVPVSFVETTEEGVSNFELIPPREEQPVAIGAARWPGMTGMTFPLKPRDESV